MAVALASQNSDNVRNVGGQSHIFTAASTQRTTRNIHKSTDYEYRCKTSTEREL